jgi:hypothetical protein
MPSMASNSLPGLYAYGPSQTAVEQINNSTGAVTYLHHDQAGSTRLLTGSTGKVEGKCSYGADGALTCEGTTTTPLGYDGQYTSPDTGLIYLRNRVYEGAVVGALDASGAGEEELGVEAADQGIAGVIKGYTQHGLEQAIERDAGRGVSPSAILDAVRSPLSESVQDGGRTKFVGQNAVVVVNSEGQIVTTYPLNSAGLRGQP